MIEDEGLSQEHVGTSPMAAHLYQRGLAIVRAETQPIFRARLLAMYGIRAGPGELQNELFEEMYAAVEQTDPHVRGPLLQELTLALMQARIL